MFSFKVLQAREDLFIGLLRASAQEAHESVKGLQDLLQKPVLTPALGELVLVRRREKEIAEEIAQELIKAFMTSIEREDIEALSHALYKIPKSVEKFAERYQLAPLRLRQLDFIRPVALLEQAAALLPSMVGGLQHSRHTEHIKDLHNRLHEVETEYDRLLLELLREVYSGQHEALDPFILKDLHELLEKAFGRCTDAASIILNIALKNS
jgi:uncharacterized protein Yka (UPF0111/DUF47 family)